MPTRATQTRKTFQSTYGAWAIIAGASEGLGEAYAEALAGRGLNLVLIARRQELLEGLAARLTQTNPIQVHSLALDLALPQANEQIIQATQSLEVGLLVYNAAYSAVGAFYEHSMEDHLREIDTNVLAPLQPAGALGKRMLAAGRGGIILMSSLSAFQGSAYIATYSATKAFNIVLAEGLWEEWRRRGVDVLACVSGAIRTPNYLESAPKRTGGLADATIPPAQVVREALAALGRRPVVIPGKINRISSFVMRRVLSRRRAVQIMGNVLRGMYMQDEKSSAEEKA